MRTNPAHRSGALSLLCTAIVLLAASPTLAHGIDPFSEHAAPLLHSHAQLPVGYVGDDTLLADLAQRLASLRTLTGHTLLPIGSRAEVLSWDENVVEIGLTLGGLPAGWTLSTAQATYISDIFAQPFQHDPTFGGVRLLARVGEDAEFENLQPFLADGRPLASQAEETRADPDYIPQPYPAGTVFSPARGPTGQAARQPTGALSGVTVFLSAGHGWTAGGSSWYLQRPVLLDMCEDYGNIDQLNYMAHFAYNAGATVVPFRPVGWQPIEIILDNDDPGVTYTGAWNNGSSPKYYEDGDVLSGIVYKFTDSQPSQTATARYTPNITQTDYYPVYCFTIASANRTLQTYRVSHSGGVSEVTIDHRMVGNGWIWLGDYYLEAGGDNYVEITNASPEAGAIVADAIRWGGGTGDIARPGPGTISGFPRDEEAQRYWAQKELDERAVGFDSNIWDIDGIDDGGDNVRTGAKWAREMNQTPAGGVFADRWKRVHLEFHTNAFSGSVRGQICLITSLNPTTYQQQFANILSDEVDADMLIMDSEFEHPWFDRSSPTLTSAYGAISGDANGNEFDATIVELAFHDEPTDAELLRDPFVRRAMARSCVQGIIKFLGTLPGSQIPQVFLPDVPRAVYAVDQGAGNVLLSWAPPLSDEARGDPATGYVIYQSTNGFGFGDPIVLGNVTSHMLTNVPADETRYYRIAATNAGGESMPSPVLAVRRPADGTAGVLIVNGFESLGREITPLQDLPGGTIERQIFRSTNSYDYVIEYAEALAANGEYFTTASADPIEALELDLNDYELTVWMLGNEPTRFGTLSGAAQTRLENYLLNGGGLFITGANIAASLIANGQGASFAEDILHIRYAADASGSYALSGAPTGILSDVGVFDFNPVNGARYDARSADRLNADAESQVCLTYGNGTTAGVQYTSEIYNAVTFAVPFETITSPAIRAEIMGEVVTFLRLASGPLPFDYDRDNDIDFQDFTVMLFCWKGPDDQHSATSVCARLDGNEDLDVDLADFGMMQPLFTGPNE